VESPVYNTSNSLSAQAEDLDKLGQFDAVIGRFVLVHQPYPAAVVRRSAAAMSPRWASQSKRP
jgi:hypothetical protein